MGAACVTCHALDPDDLMTVESCTNKHNVRGPGFKVVGLGKSATVRKCTRLGPIDYAVVEATLTGELRLEKGPKMFFPDAYDRILRRAKAIALRQNEYVKLQDTSTGAIRVVRGEDTVYMEPLEELVRPEGRFQPCNDGVWRAFEVDLETAVIVRDQLSGEQRLVSEPQLFFCDVYEEIISIRKLLSLADHETVVLKERSGEYIFINGSDEAQVVPAIARDGDTPSGQDSSLLPGVVPKSPVTAKAVELEAKTEEASVTQGSRSFFVPPYTEIETFLWSAGIKKDKVTDKITLIDRRPQFMNYEFECRTSDNVELVLKVTFFWQIIDVPLMLKFTSDPRGDVCHHARSAVIQHVTKVSMEEFMKNFNTIVDRAIFGRGTDFYTQRGVKIHTVEVLHFHCKDMAIEKVLQQIIQESTNRLNRLQQQESENEVAVHRLRGDIEEERMRGDLLRIKHSHHRDEALMEGEAEADRCKAFINGLSDVVDVQDALKLFNTLRKVEVMGRLSEGPAHMYFTPSDCDLSIETRIDEAARGAGAGSGQKKRKNAPRVATIQE